MGNGFLKGAVLISTALVLLLAGCNTATPPGDTEETGSLAVVITGTPAGVPAGVTVSGASGFTTSVTTTTTLDELPVGSYTVRAEAISDGTDIYGATVTGSPANVSANATSTATVSYSLQATGEAAIDGDDDDDPGLFVHFRNTPAPSDYSAGLEVDEPLFNGEAPIQTRGLRYSNSTSIPGDFGDYIAFEINHGEVDSTLVVELACTNETGTVSLRATIIEPNGDEQSIGCDSGQVNFVLANEGTTDGYLIVLEPNNVADYFTDYTLTVDAFCPPGGCTFTPYQE